MDQHPILLPRQHAGQRSSALAVQQRGMEQPRLTLPIPAQALVTHGPHPASVYCFQPRQIPCHAWRIASSSVYFSAAAYSWLPGLASWLLSLLLHHIESVSTCINHCMHVRAWWRRRWWVYVRGGGGEGGCFGGGNFSKRVIKKRTWWDGWKAISAY